MTRHRRKRNPENVGAQRIKLADLLRARGFDAAPEKLWWNRGAYAQRTSDYARWGTYTTLVRARDGYFAGFPVQLHSWDTMTDCARYGIEVEHMTGSREVAGTYQVHALDPKRVSSNL